MKTFNTYIGFIVLAALVSGLYFQKNSTLSGTVDTDFISSKFTKGSVNVSTTRTLVLDLNGARQWASICLDGTTANFPAYLHFTSASTTVATTTGKPIVSYATTNGDNCFIIGKDFKYPGQVWAITNTSTAQKIITEEN